MSDLWVLGPVPPGFNTNSGSNTNNTSATNNGEKNPWMTNPSSSNDSSIFSGMGSSCNPYDFLVRQSYGGGYDMLGMGMGMGMGMMNPYGMGMYGQDNLYYKQLFQQFLLNSNFCSEEELHQLQHGTPEEQAEIRQRKIEEFYNLMQRQTQANFNNQRETNRAAKDAEYQGQLDSQDYENRRNKAASKIGVATSNLYRKIDNEEQDNIIPAFAELVKAVLEDEKTFRNGKPISIEEATQLARVIMGKMIQSKNAAYRDIADPEDAFKEFLDDNTSDAGWQAIKHGCVGDNADREDTNTLMHAIFDQEMSGWSKWWTNGSQKTMTQWLYELYGYKEGDIPDTSDDE